MKAYLLKEFTCFTNVFRICLQSKLEQHSTNLILSALIGSKNHAFIRAYAPREFRIQHGSPVCPAQVVRAASSTVTYSAIPDTKIQTDIVVRVSAGPTCMIQGSCV